MIRVYIVDSDPVFRARVTEAARLAGDVDVIGVSDDPKASEALIRLHGPQVVLIGLAPPARDGFGLLRRLIVLPPEPRPKIVATAPASAEDDLAEAVAMGADYAVLKPCRLDTLLNRVRQLGSDEMPWRAEERRSRRDAAARDVADRLHRMGMSPRFKGHRYLIDAIVLVAFDRSLLERVTTGLYPTVARRHGTTAQRVERAIRNAIEVTLTRGNLDEIERVFGRIIDPGKGKLSNSSFIAQMADHVRLQLRVG